MSSEVAPGMPFMLPNGMVIKNNLENYWKEMHQKSGYEEIKTPIMMKQYLWEQSGHWEHYHENMYFSKVDEQNYAVKPMNCPGAVIIYNQKKRSYRDLPIRLAELGLVHRHELSGSLNGLLRVRSFTQDDAHLFVRMDQIESEINAVLDLVKQIYSKFGFSYKVELSTRPEDFMGEVGMWDVAEHALERILKRKNVDFMINKGDGAFYGPKIDFHVEDSLGRSWQCGTIQLDFQMPIKFDCSYINEKGEEQRPIIIHRAIFGSVERFMAILIEHYQGEFPLWLSPKQVSILSVNENCLEYCVKIKERLEKSGFRVNLDGRDEKIGYKIHQYSISKIPYALIIGDREKNNSTVSIRKRNQKMDEMDVDIFVSLLEKDNQKK
jgi:threonyl-tRNA synthetase